MSEYFIVSNERIRNQSIRNKSLTRVIMNVMNDFMADKKCEYIFE